MARILLTGTTGQVGSELLTALSPLCEVVAPARAELDLTNTEAAQVFSRVLSKPVKFKKLPMPMVRLVMSKEFYQMFRWFNDSGFKANVPELRRKYPEVRLQTLEEWLRNEGWHKRARHLNPPKE